MLSWIVRILLILAAPLAALLVSRDALNFGLVQTMVAITLMVAFVALGAAWTARGPRTPRKAAWADLRNIGTLAPELAT